MKIPGNVYVEEAVLEGEMVCIGSAANWLVWNWREDTIAHLHLKDVVVSLFQSNPGFCDEL
jgi:hypothetical protein